MLDIYVLRSVGQLRIGRLSEKVLFKAELFINKFPIGFQASEIDRRQSNKIFAIEF